MLLVRIVWFILLGWWLGAVAISLAWLLNVLIITLPVGLFILNRLPQTSPCARRAGTGTPEPGGLTPRELFPLLRRLCAETNVVGMELVELNPLVDPTYVTPLVANRCAREMLTGVAMRKKGLTEKHYLAPETVDHGQG